MKVLKELRAKKGWTQAKLGEQLGVTPNAITMWEAGERKPNIIMLKKLASIFGCTTDELLRDINVES